ncbi:ParA family protein [Sebaldella sp. S0638]|uniref:ParA family protein n=1 Tax=Sebaldella sp. S0638 TaxID=2957809 RepID=UPI0020A0C2AE|nr:ParA family protein [Sebaldella sp. S0638]MCP1225504.1 ParA family protein [Sebaldella sp. S0638]
MKILSFVNPKGGAAKTVSAITFAYALVKRGKKVLLIDSDPRSSIQVHLKINNENNLIKLIMKQYNDVIVTDFENYITPKNGLDIIISSEELINLNNYFILEKKDNQAIYSCIENLLYLFEDYDYVIFDTEGTVNDFNSAILNCTDYIFTPSRASNVDLKGVIDLLDTYDIAKKKNKKLEIRKIFLVCVKERTKAYKEAKEDFENYFFDKPQYNYTESNIRDDQNIVNAMNNGLDIINFKNSSNASIDYRNLADEFLEEELEREV